MYYKWIIALDPSGAFYEGKGTTGYSIFHADENKFIDKGVIQAAGFPCAEAYWDKHLQLLNSIIFSARGKRLHKPEKTIIVIEDYLLYANRAQAQINSHFETSKLIGIIQHWCYKNKITYCMHHAGLVKTRWTDEILAHKGYLKKNGTKWEVCEHTRDSMRHAVHFATFENGKENV
jgi:hypothetical protein